MPEMPEVSLEAVTRLQAERDEALAKAEAERAKSTKLSDLLEKGPDRLAFLAVSREAAQYKAELVGKDAELERERTSHSTANTAFNTELGRLTARNTEQATRAEKLFGKFEGLIGAIETVLARFSDSAKAFKVGAAILAVVVVLVLSYFVFAKASPNRDVLAAIADVKTELAVIRGGVVTPEGKTVVGLSTSVDLRLAESQRDQGKILNQMSADLEALRKRKQFLTPSEEVKDAPDVASLLSQISNLQQQVNNLRYGGLRLQVPVNVYMRYPSEKGSTPANLSSNISLNGSAVSEKCFALTRVMDMLWAGSIALVNEKGLPENRSNVRVWTGDGKLQYFDDYLNSNQDLLKYCKTNLTDPHLFFYFDIMTGEKGGTACIGGLSFKWDVTAGKFVEMGPGKG